VYDGIPYQVKQEQKIWKNHSIPISTKIRLMKELVWLVAMYGWKGWERFCGFRGQYRKTNEWIEITALTHVHLWHWLPAGPYHTCVERRAINVSLCKAQSDTCCSNILWKRSWFTLLQVNCANCLVLLLWLTFVSSLNFIPE